MNYHELILLWPLLQRPLVVRCHDWITMWEGINMILLGGHVHHLSSLQYNQDPSLLSPLSQCYVPSLLAFKNKNHRLFTPHYILQVT